MRKSAWEMVLRRQGSRWVILAGVTAALWAPGTGAEAQFAGRVPGAQSAAAGASHRVDTQRPVSSTRKLSAQSAVSHVERRPGGSGKSPYGRLGYGRGPGYDYGDPAGSYGYDGTHSHTWSGSIDRNLQQMRRTSPRPWQFGGGYYNPRPVDPPVLYPRSPYPIYGEYGYGGSGFEYPYGGSVGYGSPVYVYPGGW